MIAKEKTSRAPSADRFLAAGDEAERQMAFYLRRAFERPLTTGLLGRQKIDVRVFNDLRLELREGRVTNPPHLMQGEDRRVENPPHRVDAVQIDHLVMHPWGLVIVESKSVTGEVVVNERGEWARKWGGRLSGMASPIEQARRQAEGLRQLLRENAATLRDRKLLGLVQGGFAACPIEIMVAISDKGMITRKGCDVPEVMKADQVVPRILEIVERHRKGSSLLSKPDEHGSGDWSMTEGEAERIASFLLSRHRESSKAGGAGGMLDRSDGEPVGRGGVARAEVAPRNVSPREAKLGKVAAAGEQLEALTCSKCRSINVRIIYAKNYCVRCDECAGFTRLDDACTACGKKARIAKQGLEFRRVCAACGAERVFFRNRE